MNSVDKAFETQIQNIQIKTGKSLEELFSVIEKSGLEKHAEIRDLMKAEFNLGYGDANTIVHVYKKSLEEALSPQENLLSSVNQIYSGSREVLRPLHDLIMNSIQNIGEFEIAPKKTYLSLRRKKQFAMVGPGTKGRIEVGLNMKGVPATNRLLEMPAGGMCQYKVWLQDKNEIDDELLSWIKIAYQEAG
ncbi:MAG TPA: DUF5655 domain-containing protein [Anaerolineaceae bacterium]|nr:DUF5655 domain-containing protein [Anaerolineaceae bacterium]